MEPLPEDKIFHFIEIFKRDQHPKKVNLTVGAYRDEEGKPWILPSVSQAFNQIIPSLSLEYLPIIGDSEFITESLKLAYGVSNGKLAGMYDFDQIAAAQTLSGTGALTLAFTILSHYHVYSCKKIYLPTPAWSIYDSLLKKLNLEVCPIQYYNETTREWDFQAFAQELDTIEPKSIIILQVSGHNPTGIDMDEEEWKIVGKKCKEKELTVVFDMAYQGFVSGDPIQDASPVRLFANMGIPFLLCQSYAKSFGLYGQRIGCLSIPLQNSHQGNTVTAYLANIIRHTYSNNPRMGSDIVKTILCSSSLKAQWHLDIKTMSGRLQNMREALVTELRKVSGGSSWDYIAKQKGMFSFTHLKLPQIQKLRNEKGIHLIDSGRISLCGLNSKNVQYVAQQFNQVTQA